MRAYTSKPTHYEVCYSLRIDAPEKRDASFRYKALTGECLHFTRVFPTAKQAVQFFEGIRGGMWDAGSEYVYKVSARTCFGTRSPHMLRRQVERTRLHTFEEVFGERAV